MEDERRVSGRDPLHYLLQGRVAYLRQHFLHFSDETRLLMKIHSLFLEVLVIIIEFRLFLLQYQLLYPILRDFARLQYLSDLLEPVIARRDPQEEIKDTVRQVHKLFFINGSDFRFLLPIYNRPTLRRNTFRARNC